ncbi:hypothetical protein [Clostridium sp. JNZ J1-5]
MKYNNILIPCEKKGNCYVESNLGYIIQLMQGHIGHAYGYIIISNDPSLRANISFRFFKIGGDKDYYEYRGTFITIEELKLFASNSFVSVQNLSCSTINQFYKLQLNNSISIPYNYLISLGEDINCYNYHNSFDMKSLSTNYETKGGYEGKLDIVTFTNGEGKTIDEIVLLLKNEYNMNKITRNIYKYFLSSKGIAFLCSRISGIKDRDAYTSANGGFGLRNQITYLFDISNIEYDLPELNCLINL